LGARGTSTLLNSALLSAHFLFADHTPGMCRARTALLLVARPDKGPTFIWVKWIFDCKPDRCYREICSDNSPIIGQAPNAISCSNPG
jgi:hypothetical protein